MIQPFERAVEWTVKDSLKDSLLPPPCGEAMKLHWLTARLEHAGQISTEKISCQSWTNCYFVILFCLLHFLFQRDLVSVSLVYEYDLVTS